MGIVNDHLEELLLAKYDELIGLNESRLEPKRIEDLATVVGGATPSKKNPAFFTNDGIGWITPKDLSGTSNKFIGHGADDITQEGYDSCSVKLLPKGSVLFSSRAPIGYIAIAENALTTNQGFKSLQLNKGYGTAFAYCLLVRNKERIADAGSGTTFPEVSASAMRSMDIALPPADEISGFECWAEGVLSQQYGLEKETRLLASLRDVLLPKLMSGEIDVAQIDLTQLNGHLAYVETERKRLVLNGIYAIAA